MPEVAWVQYGCFGLVSGLVIWALIHGIPSALTIHKEAVTAIATEHKETVNAMLEEFKREATECREERMAVAAQAAAEREKDRASRQAMLDSIERSQES